MTAVDNSRRPVTRDDRSRVIERAREQLRSTERVIREREREREELMPRLRRAGYIR